MEPGKLFLIMGRGTFSAAMYISGRLETHARAIVVGEPTGGAPNFVGEVSMFKLPFSGLLGSISTLYHQNTFASDERAYIPPRIYTPPTYAAWKAGRDPAMEAIMEYLSATRS